MTKTKIFLTAFIAVICFACGNNASKGKSTTEKTDNTTTTTTPKKEDKTTTDTNADTKDAFEIKAQFVDFNLGDAEHYMFKDDGGHDWDFGKIEDKTYEFAIELPKDKANDQNQGWAANKKLKGKWFNIKYVDKDMRQYEGGPMAKVPVIIKIKEAE